MNLIESDDIDKAYREILTLILQGGEPLPSRLGPTLDIGPTAVSLAPGKLKLLKNQGRAISPGLAIVEACWILSGRRTLAPLASIAPRFRAFSDDGEILSGAYGERLRSRFGFDQIKAVTEHLRADPHSRRAFSLIAEPSDSRSVSRDVPCNVALIFRRTGEVLDMTVVNRSNDVIFGLPYDIFSFSLLHFHVAEQVGVPMGRHLHIANSMHLYLANRDLAERSLTSGASTAGPTNSEADSFMKLLVNEADAIGSMDICRIEDAGLSAMLQASVHRPLPHEAPASLHGDDWLMALWRCWAGRGPTSAVPIIQQGR